MRERRTVMIAVVGLLAAIIVVVGGYVLLSLKPAASPPGPLTILQLIPPANTSDEKIWTDVGPWVYKGAHSDSQNGNPRSN